ncbi:GNAT family N-acetyltransferase [Pleionea sediminis]|uniref:GNAT family N-acetyltransferase n=1 Tax=Pleionea sediminis TaxID=2569479 RepID=UPI0011867A8C|nr:GNAT family N-acetyltransferase [Pleionea sediminis]
MNSTAIADSLAATIPNLVTQLWTEEEFANKQQDWSSLLELSDSDPIFLSWEWMYYWWKNFSRSSDELRVIAVYSGNELVGIAPLYLSERFYLHGLIKTRSLQLMGKRQSKSGGIRAEYMDFIIHPQFRESGIRAIFDFIYKSTNCDEIVLEDFLLDSPNWRFIDNELTMWNFYRRVDSEGCGYVIDCQGEFSDYLSALGRNTRLRLYLRRKRLKSMGDIRLIDIQEFGPEKFFSMLKSCHEARWGKSFLNDSVVDFIEKISSNYTSGPISMTHSSVLVVGDQPVSFMLNFEKDGKIHFISGGYLENFNKRLALGTLHLGYMLEECFKNADVYYFDLLEGKGKNVNYKKKLAKTGPKMITQRCIRSQLLKLIFKFYDKWLRY